MSRCVATAVACALLGFAVLGCASASSEYYDALGVSNSATQADIEAAYKSVARVNHPDADASPEAAARFEQAAKAFQVLGSPDRRAHHDQALNDGQLVPPDFEFRRAMDVFEQQFPDTVVHVNKQGAASTVHMSTTSSSTSAQQVHSSIHMATTGGASQAAATSSTTKLVDGHKLTRTTNVATDESGRAVRQVSEYVDDELVSTTTEEVVPESDGEDVAALPAPTGNAVGGGDSNGAPVAPMDDIATRVGGPSPELLEKLKSADAHRSQFQQDILAQHNAQLANHQRMMAEHQERMREHQERMKQHMLQMKRMRQGEL